MEQSKSLKRWAAVAIVISLVLAWSFEALSTKAPAGDGIRRRADLVVIDTVKTFGTLERPAVVFLHDLHTDALAKESQSCQNCHLPEKAAPNRLSLKFKRLADVSRKAVMDVYHNECIGCHKEKAAAGKKAGPLESCQACHRQSADLVSNRLPMGFDKSLHFRHTESVKDRQTSSGDCAACHHEYDAAAKKLVYAKDREGSCRYCHKETSQENRISMRLASHLDCIACHRSKIAVKMDAGPVNCAGCHDPEARQKIARLDNVPRMQRKQPDIVLVRVGLKKDQKTDTARMAPVPFNHQLHEAANSTCRICHHESLQSCSQCHTPAGAKEGGFVRLETAMHQAGSDQSCIGCHAVNRQKPQCAACHVKAGENSRPADATCQACHVTPASGPVEAGVLEDPQMAERLYRQAKEIEITYRDEEIPDKVTVGIMSDRYEPAEVPHRKMIRTLLNNIREDKLAAYYHREKGAVCQGCHHNSPASLKPPQCASCHGRPFDPQNASRPGLKGAYHQQCMGCHRTLKLAKPAAAACTDCHKEKQGRQTTG